jgi:hypothetical protein
LHYLNPKIAKNTFTFCNHEQNPKIALLFSISLLISLVYFIAIYFLLFILFCFINTKALCLTTTGWSGGTRQRTCFAGCLTRLGETSSTVSRGFDIKPRVTLVGKILLLHQSALGVATNWHIYLVS